MSGTSNRKSLLRLSAGVLVAAVLALPVQAADRGKRDGLGLGVGVSVGGIKAGVDARVGGSRGLVDADVRARAGGRNGLKADAKANVGGSRGLADADMKAGLGGRDGVNARAKANVGGSDSLADADIRATVGGRDGLAAGVGATVGGRGLVDADVDVSLGDDDVLTRPDRRDPRTPGDDDRWRPDPDDRTVVREFSRLSGGERMQLIKRCRGVTSDGYDVALVKLCRLLETAAR
ncbi:hypothetical protein [Shinella granuli]|uniref:Uncharacterized protein n=1 Tax=Shinella granuli TaxID=323621 RepID=A0A4R2D3T3_SHIGR|nr:hypothetical protein [Shinella granuli]TCN48296.1 hypothetical protein EV665_10128 [Shinella granuli]